MKAKRSYGHSSLGHVKWMWVVDGRIEAQLAPPFKLYICCVLASADPTILAQISPAMPIPKISRPTRIHNGSVCNTRLYKPHSMHAAASHISSRPASLQISQNTASLSHAAESAGCIYKPKPQRSERMLYQGLEQHRLAMTNVS